MDNNATLMVALHSSLTLPRPLCVARHLSFLCREQQSLPAYPLPGPETGPEPTTNLRYCRFGVMDPVSKLGRVKSNVEQDFSQQVTMHCHTTKCWHMGITGSK